MDQAQRASANGAGMTAEDIMTECQTDACYLQGILQGINILLDFNEGPQADQARSAIVSLTVQAEKMATGLARDLDSANIGRKP